MRVGTKLMLLVLLPVTSLIAFASIAAVSQWKAADRLRDFRSAARLSFASADAAEALADERTAETLHRLGVGSADASQLTAARLAVDAALRRAAPRAPGDQAAIGVMARL
jgi:hypothetical protein